MCLDYFLVEFVLYIGSIVGLGWNCGERCFDHAMGRGVVGIAIFCRWCCYDPTGIEVEYHS